MNGSLSDSAREWFSIGLGGAFLVTLLFLVRLLREEDVNRGFLGMAFLLTIIFFLIGFSFLVAAATPGISIKVAVGVVDALVLFGSRLLAPNFLEYLLKKDTGQTTLETAIGCTKKQKPEP